MNKKNLRNQKFEEKSDKNQTPSWISPFSWIGSVIFSSMIFLICICGAPELNLAIVFFYTIFYFLIAKIILYIIPFAIFKIWKIIKSGSGKILDSAATNMSKRINSAMEKGREEAKVEQEKQILRQKINDLELQELKNRIKKLEEELHDKNK